MARPEGVAVATRLMELSRVPLEDAACLREAVGAFLQAKATLDQARGLDAPQRYSSIEEVPGAQLHAVHAFVRDFSEAEALELREGTLAEGVVPLSPQVVQAFAGVLLSKDGSVGLANAQNLAALHRGFLHALVERVGRPLTQSEADAAALFSLGTDSWYKGVPLDRLRDMPVAPSNVTGPSSGTYRQIEERLRERAHRLLNEIASGYEPLPDNVRSIFRNWIDEGNLPPRRAAVEQQAHEERLSDSEKARLLKIWHAFQNEQSAWPLVQSFLHGTHAHALLPFDPLWLAVLDAGGDQELAQQVYFVQQAHGANFFLNWVQHLADIRPDFVHMEQQGHLSPGSADLLGRLYDAQSGLSERFFRRIQAANRGELTPDELRGLQRELAEGGRDLQEALVAVGTLAELQLRLDDRTNFDEHSFPKWREIARQDAGSSDPQAVGQQLAAIANQYYLNQVARGPEVAEEFVRMTAPGFATEGVYFNPEQGQWMWTA